MVRSTDARTHTPKYRRNVVSSDRRQREAWPHGGQIVPSSTVCVVGWGGGQDLWAPAHSGKLTDDGRRPVTNGVNRALASVVLEIVKRCLQNGGSVDFEQCLPGRVHLFDKPEVERSDPSLA